MGERAASCEVRKATNKAAKIFSSGSTKVRRYPDMLVIALMIKTEKTAPKTTPILVGLIKAASGIIVCAT